MKLAHLGTFDVDNYGDLLYPLVIEHLFLKRCPSISLARYAFIEGPAPQSAGYNVSPIKSLLGKSGPSFDGTVIGGGDILRTDNQRLASHYAAIYARALLKQMRYRLMPSLMKTKSSGDRFMKDHMSYGAPGPFILDQRKTRTTGKIVYCSIGVPFNFEPAEAQEVAEAINASSFIYVRDKQSRDKLVAAGVTRPILVAPDAIVTLSDFVPPEKARAAGRAFLARHGLRVEQPILTFQCTPRDNDTLEIITHQLLSFQRRTGTQIALLPIGRCHGDEMALQAISAKAGGAFAYLSVSSVREIQTAIAASNYFCGTSMHGNITAFSYGVPSIFGPLRADKVNGYLEVVGLSPDLKISSWNMLDVALDRLTGTDCAALNDLAEKAKSRVYAAADAAVTALSSAYAQ